MAAIYNTLRIPPEGSDLLKESPLPVDIIVCVKQVMDPEIPPSAFHIDPETKRVREAPGISPVVNGFDENAVEAALQIRDQVGGTITVLSVGAAFAMDVMKKPLSMGADELVLAQDDAFADLDARATARVLAQAISKIGRFDLVLCGRQASDWDNAHVPLGLAELLDVACLTVAQGIEVIGNGVVVNSVTADGYDVIEADMPALVTVSNELGEPRYPTLRGIMAAGRKKPTTWSADDLGIEPDMLEPGLSIVDLYVPESGGQVEMVEGEDEADAGRNLALRLRESGLI